MKLKLTLLAVCALMLPLAAQKKIVHLDFENPVMKIDTAKNFTLQVEGKVKLVDGVKGKGMLFDGATNSIRINTYNNKLVQFGENQSFTIEYYFRSERKSSKGWIFQAAFGGIIFAGRPIINTPFLWINNGNKRIFDIGTGVADMNDGKFHHIAFVRDAKEGTFSFYVDGILQKKCKETSEFKKVAKENKFIYVGSGSPNWRGWFKGVIDEFIIYDYAKTDFSMKDLQKSYTSQPPAKVSADIKTNWKILKKYNLDLAPCPKEIATEGKDFAFDPAEWQIAANNPAGKAGYEAFLKHLEECGKAKKFSAAAKRKISAILYDEADAAFRKKYKKTIRQGYVLSVSSDRIIIAGADADGLRYGWLTLGNLLRDNGRMVTALIRDWPSFQSRHAYTYPYFFSESALKAMIDEAFAARINIIERTGISSISRAKIPPYIRKVNEYAAERGIKVAYTIAPAVEELTAPNWRSQIPKGYDGHYFPYKTAEGMHGWMWHAISWSRDDLVVKRAKEIADFCNKHKFSLISFHPVDAGGVDNPANWGYRTERDKKRWGNDFTGAEINLINTFADNLKKHAPQVQVAYVVYPYMPGLLLTDPFPEHLRRIKKDMRPDIWLLRREGQLKDIQGVDALIDTSRFWTVFYPFGYGVLPLYSHAGRYMKTFYKDTTSRAGLEVWAPGGLVGDAYKYVTAEYLWTPDSPGCANLPYGYGSFNVIREKVDVIEKELLPRICGRLYGEKAADVMAEYFSSKLSERYAEHPNTVLPSDVDQEKFFENEVKNGKQLLAKMNTVEKFVKPSVLANFKSRRTYLKKVIDASAIRLVCVKMNKAVYEGDFKKAEKYAAEGMKLLNSSKVIKSALAYKNLKKELNIKGKLGKIAARKEYAVKFAPQPCRVAFYSFTGTGSHLANKMIPVLFDSFNNICGIRVSEISDLSVANLKNVDVLIFNAHNNVGDNTENWRENLKKFVEKDGKSIIFLHNSVGRKDSNTLFPTLFPEVCSGGSRQADIKIFKLADVPMFRSFRKKDGSYTQGYYDHYILNTGKKAEILIRDAKNNPVCAAGKCGAGKVIYYGEVFGVNSKDQFEQPELENWQMLFHLIRYANTK